MGQLDIRHIRISWDCIFRSQKSVRDSQQYKHGKKRLENGISGVPA